MDNVQKLIAAECIFCDRDSPKYPAYNKAGVKHIINTNEVEVWPVTKEYLAVLMQTGSAT